jgi:hypothetical protein
MVGTRLVLKSFSVENEKYLIIKLDSNEQVIEKQQEDDLHRNQKGNTIPGSSSPEQLNSMFNPINSRQNKPAAQRSVVYLIDSCEVDVDFPCFLEQAVDESILLNNEQHSLSEIDKFVIQTAILKRLAVINALAYFLTELKDVNDETLFSQIMSCLKIENTTNLQAQAELQSLTNRLFITKRMNLFPRFLDEDATLTLKWSLPKDIHYIDRKPLRAKDNMHIRFPYWQCNKFKTVPASSLISNYLLAIVDCEYQKLQSKSLETFIKNVALTMENALSQNATIIGATLILRGRVSRSLLVWLRGKSPLEPSLIPSIEIVYAIPGIECDNIISKSEEYLFTLKKGKKFRLSKNNKSLSSDYLKDVYEKWQNLRSFIKIDELIRCAISDSLDNHEKFIVKFWQYFHEQHTPGLDIPVWKVVQNSADDKLNDLITAKLSEYRRKLEMDIKSQNKKEAATAGDLLDKFNRRINLTIELLAQVKTMASTIDLKREDLFYLDWSHIIADLLKEKNYAKTFFNIYQVTPEFLTEYNVKRQFFRNHCFLKIFDKQEAQIEISFSEMEWKENEENIKDDKSLFNWSLLNIIMIYAQLDNDKENIKPQIDNYLEQILIAVELKWHHLFIMFIKAFQQSKIQHQTQGQLYSDITEEFRKLFLQKPKEFNISIIELFIDILNSKIEKYNKIHREERENERISLEDNLQSDGGIDSLFDDSVDKLSNIQDVVVPSENELSPVVVKNNSILLPTVITTELDIVLLLEEARLIQAVNQSVNLRDIKRLLNTYEPSMESCQFSSSENGGKNSDINKLFALKGFLRGRKVHNGWQYFYFLNVHYTNDNVVKLIYVILENDEVIVAPEPLRGDRSSRPAHSELARGRGIKAGGELIFYYDGLKWNLRVINNGSGHYRPPAHLCLPVARQIILGAVNKNIVLNNVQILNSLKPGMTLASGFDEDEGQVYIPDSEGYGDDINNRIDDPIICNVGMQYKNENITDDTGIKEQQKEGQKYFIKPMYKTSNIGFFNRGMVPERTEYEKQMQREECDQFDNNTTLLVDEDFFNNFDDDFDEDDVGVTNYKT